MVTLGGRDARPNLTALSYVEARVTPSAGGGRWAVATAVSALTGGNVIRWTKRAVIPLGVDVRGGDRFLVAVPRGLRPAFDGVAVLTGDGASARAAYRVEFGHAHDPDLPPVSEGDPERVEFAWAAADTTLSAHVSADARARVRERAYEVAAQITAYDNREWL
ncbi:hypothetical protein [Ornithinimicrobium cavernae]|uniref:hypothetical protein n=1 Tax=Ornithinimicrobium cavernae TaxID=2666047 RepID=UPI000D69EBFE|nr:hypothetical protein [Ornithinimicrobium cavernae]